MNENSSLLFGVDTKEARASLALLRAELKNTLSEFRNVHGATASTSAANAGLSNSYSTIASTVDDTDSSYRQATRTLSNYKKVVDGVTWSTRVGVATSASVIEKANKALEKSLANPRSAAAYMQREALQTQRIKDEQKQAQEALRAREQAELAAAKRHQARLHSQTNLNRRYYEKDTAARLAQIERIDRAMAEGVGVKQIARTHGMAPLRDNRQRLAELAEYTRSLKEATKWEAEQGRLAAHSRKIEDAQDATRRKAKVSASKETFREISRWETEQGRLATQNRRLAEAQEIASRKARVESARAAFAEQARMERAAEDRHRTRLTRQADLSQRYYEKDTKARLAQLNRIDRALGAGVSTTRVARTHGLAALADRSNRDRYAEELAQTTKLAGRGTTDVNRLTGAFGQNAKAMREVHSAARGLSGALGSLWMTYGSIAPLLAGAAIGGMAKSTFSVGKDVEYRLQMLQALGNAPASVGDLMPAVHGSMQTPLQAAEGLQTLAQAGLKTHEALTVLVPTLRLATLGEMSVADAALTTTAALNTFGMAMYESVKVGDIFAKGASISNASVAEIAESMKQAGAGAAAYGATLEETVAQIAVMAQAGIKGSAAGTAVRNSMRELYAPTDKAAKAMKQFGISAYDNSGEARNFVDILNDLKAVTVDMDPESVNHLLQAMFNERSRRGIQIFLSDMGRLEKMVEELGSPDGYLAKANDMLLDTVEGASNRLQSVLQQSYVQAFDALNPQIRATIKNLEELVGGTGFKEFVEGTGTTISTLTSYLSEHAGTIAALAAGYAGLKVATGLWAATTAGAGAAVTGLQAVTLGYNIVLGRNNQVLVDNTKNATLNAVAQGHLSGAMGRTAAAATLAGTAFRGMTAAMGVLGAAISVVSLAVFAFSRDTTSAAEQSDLLRQKTEAVTTSIRQEIAAIEERRRQRLLDAGVTLESDEKGMAARYDEVAKLDKEAANLRAELAKATQELNSQAPSAWDDLTVEALGASPSLLNNRTAELLQKRIELTQKLSKVEEEAHRKSIGIDEDERVRELGKFKRAEAQLESRLMQEQTMLRTQLDDVKRSASNSPQRAFLPELESGLKENEKLLATIGNEASVSKEQVDTFADSMANLHKRIADTRQLRFGDPDKDPGGGSGALEFRSSSANIQTELRNQQSLLKGMRDFKLNLLETETKEGVWSEQESAAQRMGIWENYYKQYENLALQASNRIRGLDKGSDALKELTAEKIAESVAQEKRLADQDYALSQRKQEEESASRARLENMRREVELSSTLETIERDREQFYRSQMDQYLSNEVLAGMAERNRVEALYNKILDDRRQRIHEGLQRNPDFMSTPEGRQLRSTIDTVELAKGQQGDIAYATGEAAFRRSQDVLSGYHRALKDVGDQAIATGDLVAESLGASFRAVSGLAGDLATTGKVNMREFFADLTSQIARMYANQMVMQLLSAFMPSFGAKSGGGGVNLIGLRPTPNALGNAFDSGSVTRFADGGAFTNTIAKGTTVAPMAMFGEAGPEAIMPLTRTSGGKLGVSAVGGGGSGVVVYLNVSTNVYADGTSTTDASTDSNAPNFIKQMTDDIVAVVDERVRKHLGQGGMIRKGIKEYR